MNTAAATVEEKNTPAPDIESDAASSITQINTPSMCPMMLQPLCIVMLIVMVFLYMQL